MKLDRRRFLGSAVGAAATAGVAAEWTWPKYCVSYHRPFSSVAVLSANGYSEKLEALLLDGLRLFVSFRQRCVVEVATETKSGLFRILSGRLDSKEQLVPFVMLAGWRRASAGEGLIE
jgi:hypothetical protein